MEFFDKTSRKIIKTEQVNITINFYVFKIVQVSKVQLKLTILNFLAKLTQQEYIQSRNKKLKIPIEFCIFELI